MDIVINGRFLSQHITGVQRYACELTQALDTLLEARPEHRITVMSPQLSGTLPTWRNIGLHQVGCLQGHAWEQFELPWYSSGQTLFCPGNTAPLASLLGTQRVVVTVHDLGFRCFPEAYSKTFRLWYGFLIPLAVSRASAVITVSDAERTAILKHYPTAAARLHVISNGCLPASIKRTGEFPDIELADRTYILYAGSLSRHKNFQGALEAAIRLVRKRGFHFVFIGGIAGGILASEIKVPRDAASHITFAGRVDDAVLFRHYSRAACFLFPSFYEASGLPPLEAMASGCPTVVSDIPALKERCGDAAIYCDPHDIDSIATAVERVMDDDVLRSKLKALGLQRAASYSWEACALETLNLITQLP